MGPSADTTSRDVHAKEHAKSEAASVKNKILLAIPPAEYRLIHPYLEPVALRHHTILHEPTQELEFAYFPNQGLLSLLVGTEDGKTVDVAMVGNEGVAGVAAVGLTISTMRQLVQGIRRKL
jgi:hypothetical protein